MVFDLFIRQPLRMRLCPALGIGTEERNVHVLNVSRHLIDPATQVSVELVKLLLQQIDVRLRIATCTQ
ncbi:hypothetical protein D3C84_679120 [compost metagenome]